MPPTDPIQHVVLLMLENHSFDQMLGCLKAVNPDVNGVDLQNPGKNTDSDGRVYFQKETDEVQTVYDPRHELIDVQQQIADSNGGFVANFSKTYPRSSFEDRQQIMGYYGLGKLPALHALAQDFTVCDQWFSSLPGPTWPNRFFALSGTSNGEIQMPESTLQDLNPSFYFHQNQDTIFDRLNSAGRSWKVYYYDFPNSWLLLHQLEHPENLSRYHHIDKFFAEVSEPAGFPDFVFIEPKYFGQDQNDDHPPHNVIKAEKLVADVYNALRSSPLWDSTLLIVTFDEHGGFYDHVVPPPAIPPDDKQSRYAFNQYGVRVPALLISPWVGRRAEHTLFDHTSVLRYLSDKWGLAPLGQRTASANSIAAGITESTARTDTVPFIRVPYASLIAPSPELEKEDVSDHQEAIRGFSRLLERATDDPAYTHPYPAPGAWAKIKNSLGKKFIGLGNSLTADYQTIQDSRVRRLTGLVKDLAKSGRKLNLPNQHT
ncbi:MAG TPA: alkaline phosphatase family protein [Candidatus Angelobacter sp.]|nr:alkaline phosphatase family protein [Candidatus Angelobacter sp.]